MTYFNAFQHICRLYSHSVLMFGCFIFIPMLQCSSLNLLSVDVSDALSWLRLHVTPRNAQLLHFHSLHPLVLILCSSTDVSTNNIQKIFASLCLCVVMAELINWGESVSQELHLLKPPGSISSPINPSVIGLSYTEQTMHGNAYIFTEESFPLHYSAP